MTQLKNSWKKAQAHVKEPQTLKKLDSKTKLRFNLKQKTVSFAHLIAIDHHDVEALKDLKNLLS